MANYDTYFCQRCQYRETVMGKALRWSGQMLCRNCYARIRKLSKPKRVKRTYPDLFTDIKPALGRAG